MATLTGQLRAPRASVPWYLVLPALASAVGVLVPLGYLLAEAFAADRDTIANTVFRWRNLALLGNTLLLAAVVLTIATLLALPITYLTTRTDLPMRRLFTLLAVMPLAVPGYLLAYTLLAVGGDFGTSARLLGVAVPRLTGFWGAAVALSLYNMPYMYLNLRVAMQRMDPAFEEVARSLGHGPVRRFFGVVLPQLRPALLAGALLVTLHVLGDFGVVSLMRYETFTYALYLNYELGDLHAASWLAIMLVVVAAFLLVFEFRFLRNLRLDPVGMTTPRRVRRVRLGVWKPPSIAFLSMVALVGIGVPVVTIVFWVVRSVETAAVSGGAWGGWASALGDSLSVSIPAAVLAAVIALPIVYLAQRYPATWTRALEQSAYIGYATPALAFGLGLVLLTLNLLPSVYQTAAVLVYAYALHFLAEAVGPIRSSLFVATPRLEEASRSLGVGRVRTFMKVTLPLLRPGTLVSITFVFLACMKELPLTFILGPRNFSTLAKQVWDHTNELDFAAAAPHALTILLFSAIFVGLLLLRGRHEARD